MIGCDFFNPISRGGKMFSLVGGSARRQERAAINQFVKMNGVITYVTRKTISVPTVQIDVFFTYI